ncbi:MAG: 16S rRNA (cytosine(967)-C(5))-methyltransferase RsmB [Pseudomonadota bacterium]
MNTPASERLLACQILQSLLQQRGSLASLLNAATLARVDSPALLQEFCYGVCRWFPRLQFYLQRLLDKPLRNKDLDVHCLLLVGLYQLLFMRTPDHACVNETVEAAAKLGKEWHKNLINAVMRGALRQQAELLAESERDYSAWYAHPQWLLDRLKKDWPQRYRELLDGNNQRAPMTLRVNLRKATRMECQGLLATAGIGVRPGVLAPGSLYLAQPMDASVLPGFLEGLVSVQDEASQLVASLLPLAPGLRVLDACAAPGGKTCALLETEPSLTILALDNEARRLPRIQQNLDRLELDAEVALGDIVTENPVNFGKFARILLDVPCSAIGVIRRHPDIKVLRTAAEVEVLVAKQQALLKAAWPLLEPGGYLLYSTCSLLKAENSDQVMGFLKNTTDAEAIPLEVAGAERCEAGIQLFPQVDGTDGFYYALLRKAS